MIDNQLRRSKGYNDTGYYMDVVFTHNGKEVKDMVEIPYEVFIKGVKVYFDKRHITIDGADNAIWNTLHSLDVLDTIGESSEFAVICRDIFTSPEHQREFDAFYDKWVEDWGDDWKDLN